MKIIRIFSLGPKFFLSWFRRNAAYRPEQKVCITYKGLSVMSVQSYTDLNSRKSPSSKNSIYRISSTLPWLIFKSVELVAVMSGVSFVFTEKSLWSAIWAMLFSPCLDQKRFISPPCRFLAYSTNHHRQNRIKDPIFDGSNNTIYLFPNSDRKISLNHIGLTFDFLNRRCLPVFNKKSFVVSFYCLLLSYTCLSFGTRIKIARRLL